MPIGRPDKKQNTPQPQQAQQQAGETIQQRLEQVPFAGELQLFWRTLREMRPWWPILLPFLAWVGWRTYHTERQKVLRERARSRQQ